MASGDSPERKRRASRIVRNPSVYKVCYGCDSIVASKVSVCPNCHAYRFSQSDQEVIDQADKLSSGDYKPNT